MKYLIGFISGLFVIWAALAIYRTLPGIDNDYTPPRYRSAV